MHCCANIFVFKKNSDEFSSGAAGRSSSIERHFDLFLVLGVGINSPKPSQLDARLRDVALNIWRLFRCKNIYIIFVATYSGNYIFHSIF